MRINFLVPTPGDTPIGGVKIIYEHANHLSKQGHDVTVTHTPTDKSRRNGLFYLISTYIVRASGFRGGYGPRKWLKISPSIQIRWIPWISDFWVKESDVLIATGWTTAESGKSLTQTRGEKYYFVQDFEYFQSADEKTRARMSETYKSGFLNLVISPSCKTMVEQCGGAVFAEVPNGLDTEIYTLTEPIESENRHRIGFPARSEAFKRTDDAIEALNLVRSKHPEISVWAFGNIESDRLPNWVEYYKSPSTTELVKLYNKTKIFITPSEYEGWGLPGSEAMCCGAALVSTDNGGVNAYAKANVNALISPALDTADLAKNICKLIEDDNYRQTIASTGYFDIRLFTWQKSSSALIKAIAK